MLTSRFEVQGIRIDVRSDSDLASRLTHDFHHFVSKSRKKTRVDFAVVVAKTRGRPKGWRRVARSPRSDLFLSPAGEQRFCFFEKAFVSYRFGEGRCRITCTDPDAAYEAVYLMMLSYVGEALDRRGWHRLHGLGVAFGARGAVLLAPSGGGKSTLALKLLAGGRARLLSDDTPLVGTRGRMRAFPQRIALRERPAVAARFVRTFRRARHGEKFVVGGGFFDARVCPEAKVDWLVLLRKDAGGRARLEPISRWQMAWPLVKWLVIGYETPQIWEAFLRVSVSDVAAKAGILARRMEAAAGLLWHSRALRFTLSSDVDECERVLSRLPEQFA